MKHLFHRHGYSFLRSPLDLVRNREHQPISSVQADEPVPDSDSYVDAIKSVVAKEPSIGLPLPVLDALREQDGHTAFAIIGDTNPNLAEVIDHEAQSLAAYWREHSRTRQTRSLRKRS